MEDHEQQIRSLEQELLDERSQRHAAERRSADLSDRVDIWRTRAEERADRIGRLVEEQPGPFLGWLRPKASRSEIQPIAERVSTGSDALSGAFPSPGLRSVRVAALVSNPSVLAALGAMDCRTITDRDSIDDADLVVIDLEAMEAIADPMGLRSRLTRESGPPVVLWNSSLDSPAVRDTPWIPVDLPATFDPAVHSPAARWRIDQPEFVADTERVRFPDDALIEHAAAGGVIVPEQGIELDEISRSAASAVARRWAYRNHAPWVRARQLTEAAGIGTYDPRPSVAGVLVSNRPEMLPAALENMARQTYGRFLLVVGLHGVGDAASIAGHVERLGIARRTQVVQIPESETLGSALNRCIDRANADIIAKIDDDDAYGSSYIEDAVHALAYSGAAIVGKAAQFFYFAERDLTVLRRSGTEETLIDGTPTGASLVFHRAVWEATKLPHRPRQVDVHFVRGARLAGADVYAASRWEFRVFRGHSGHTWTADDETLLAGSVPMFKGDGPGRIHASGWPLDGD